MSTPYFLQALSRVCREKIIMKAAEAEEVGEENLNGAPARVWLFQRSAWAIAAETSKAVPRKELSMRWTMDYRLVRNISSVILSKT